MSYIAKSSIQEINDKMDALAVVGDYLRLERQGSRYVGLCPFHNEKTPSFSLNPDMKLFYCFGCGKGGTVIDFVMEMDKLSFPEAIETLAKRVGVSLVYEGPGKTELETGRDKQNEALYELYRRLTGSFHHFLMEKPEGRAAWRYIISRGIAKDMIERFRLGYAPPDRHWLFNFLTHKSYSAELLAASGLFSQDYQKTAFFADRLLFPIADRQGRTVAFGGRLLFGDGPKYLNSRESDFFKKGRTFFAIDLALPEIRKTKKAYIVEGYMDAIALHQAGVTNAVATLGTAFTDEQAKLLRRWIDRVYLIFDADEAGQKAAVKAILTCRRNALACSIVNLSGAAAPSGEPQKDPADILKERGAEALQKQIKCFINDFDFLINRSRSLFDLSVSGGKAEAVAFLFPYVETLDSEVSREACIREIGDIFRTDPQAVLADFSRWGEQKRSPAKETPRRENPVRMNYELALFAAVLVNPGWYPKVREALGGVSAIEELADPRAKDLFLALEEWYRDGGPGIDDLLSRIADNSLRNFVIAQGASEAFPAGDEQFEQFVSDGINRIKQKRLERRRAEIVMELRIIKEGEAGRRLEDLLTEKVHIDGELRRFKEVNV
jgi:DNA primase